MGWVGCFVFFPTLYLFVEPPRVPLQRSSSSVPVAGSQPQSPAAAGPGALCRCEPRAPRAASNARGSSVRGRLLSEPKEERPGSLSRDGPGPPSDVTGPEDPHAPVEQSPLKMDPFPSAQSFDFNHPTLTGAPSAFPLYRLSEVGKGVWGVLTSVAAPTRWLKGRLSLLIQQSVVQRWKGRYVRRRTEEPPLAPFESNIPNGDFGAIQ